MRISKSHRIAAVILVIAAFLVVENTLLRPSDVFRYPGVQIYDAIRDYKTLDPRGFDVLVRVEGKSGGSPVALEGKVAEASTGWFILSQGGMDRIVEGPMGSKDVLADLIVFEVAPRISVEAVFPPQETERFSLREGFRKVKGSIALDDASLSPTAVQELRNLNQEFYSLTPGRMEIVTIGSGLIMDIKVPIGTEELGRLLSGIAPGKVRTGYMYYYTGAEDEKQAEEIRSRLEGDGAVLVNYYKQR